VDRLSLPCDLLFIDPLASSRVIDRVVPRNRVVPRALEGPKVVRYLKRPGHQAGRTLECTRSLAGGRSREGCGSGKHDKQCHQHEEYIRNVMHLCNFNIKML
jgi:hypothetical protein